MFAAAKCLIIFLVTNFVDVKGSCCNIVVGDSSFMTSGAQLCISVSEVAPLTSTVPVISENVITTYTTLFPGFLLQIPIMVTISCNEL